MLQVCGLGLKRTRCWFPNRPEPAWQALVAAQALESVEALKAAQALETVEALEAAQALSLPRQ